MIRKLIFYFNYYTNKRVKIGVLVVVVVAVVMIVLNVAQITTIKNEEKINHNVEHEDISFVQRINAFRLYLLYSFRSRMYDRDEEINAPVARSRATLKKMSKDGSINFEVLTKEGVKQYSGYFADLDITDLPAAARYVSKHTLAKVSIDYYKLEDELHVVVWFNDGVPVNQLLVEKGWAKAVERPPTNIVNRLLAQYYYNIAF